MSNPFDTAGADYRVLANRAGQHSLWPGQLEVPDGWRVVHGPADRAACLRFVNQHWTDMRPAGPPAGQGAGGHPATRKD